MIHLPSDFHEFNTYLSERTLGCTLSNMVRDDDVTMPTTSTRFSSSVKIALVVRRKRDSLIKVQLFSSSIAHLFCTWKSISRQRKHLVRFINNLCFNYSTKWEEPKYTENFHWDIKLFYFRQISELHSILGTSGLGMKLLWLQLISLLNSHVYETVTSFAIWLPWDHQLYLDIWVFRNSNWLVKFSKFT